MFTRDIPVDPGPYGVLAGIVAGRIRGLGGKVAVGAGPKERGRSVDPGPGRS